jgi:hypothetical protein
VNIRKFTRRIRDLNQLVGLGALTQQAADFLRICVLGGQNILVSGATQTGKTTMLNALLSSTRPGERIVTVEETFELDLSARDVVAMQCRQPSLEGTGEITLRRLIKESLRMRPDRLVVGEVREAESLDLLIALNSGLPGMCSIHANSARDALAKLSTLPLLAGRNIDSSFVLPTVAGCIDIVVHCEIDRHGRRRVTEIIAPSGQLAGSTIEASPLNRPVRIRPSSRSFEPPASTRRRCCDRGPHDARAGVPAGQRTHADTRTVPLAGPVRCRAYGRGRADAGAPGSGRAAVGASASVPGTVGDRGCGIRCSGARNLRGARAQRCRRSGRSAAAMVDRVVAGCRAAPR